MPKPLATRARIGLLACARAALPGHYQLNDTLSDRQIQELVIRHHFPAGDLTARSDQYVAHYFASLEPYFELRRRSNSNDPMAPQDAERTDARTAWRPVVVDDGDAFAILEGGIPRALARQDADTLRAAGAYEGAIARDDDVSAILDGALPESMTRPPLWHDRQRIAARAQLPPWRQPLGDASAPEPEPPRTRADGGRIYEPPPWRRPLGHHRKRGI